MTEPTPLVPCTHCGLDFAGDPESEAPQFCCVGCEAVYHAIGESGLETFYRLREISSNATAQPAPVSQTSHLAAFDSAEFIGEHTRTLDDGTREVCLYLEGVHCAGCVWITERMPFLVEGVHDARLDLSRARLKIRWNPETTPLSELARWLGRFGYVAHAVRKDAGTARNVAERALLIRVAVCWALAANVMLLAIAFYGGLEVTNDFGLATGARYVSLILSGISLLYGGSVFFRRAAASFKGALSHGKGFSWRHLSMDVPISLGILVGWVHSAWATVAGTGEVWFDSIAVLIAAVLTARWLQMRGKRFATDAADRLVALIPSVARKLTTSDEGYEEILAHKLEIGDVIEVRAGEVVAADGIIVTGTSAVHRAIVTGESRPEAVEAGQSIEAGVTNLRSVLTVRVTAAGDETRIGKLMRWVEDHANRRAPVVQLADRLGGYFVLVVLAAAAITGTIWAFVDPAHAVGHVVALLVISCPCALGMATPLALTVGVGKAARRGIYIKHDDVLELLARADYVVFDKTGTLTEGKMAVADFKGDEEALDLAAALEVHSNHPVAQAIASSRKRASRALTVTDAREIPGAGMEGLVDGREVLVGRMPWLLERLGPGEGIEKWQAAVATYAGRALSPVAVAVDGEVRAMIAIGDRLRPKARELVAELERRSITPIILSGDHPEVVRKTAHSLGIDANFAHGGADPEQKRAFIDAFKTANPDKIVVMVGDGVNDAASLQRADVGIAVHGGAEATLVAADIFVTREGIEPVLEILDGSRRVMAVVRRNIGGSAFYNALGISFAAAGMVSPLLAAVAMPMSSLGVVISSLVQRSFAPPQWSEPGDAIGGQTEEGEETASSIRSLGAAVEHS